MGEKLHEERPGRAATSWPNVPGRQVLGVAERLGPCPTPLIQMPSFIDAPVARGYLKWTPATFPGHRSVFSIMLRFCGDGRARTTMVQTARK